MQGRTLVAAMSAAQVGSLLPHVVVPAVMPAHLIPLWNLSNADAGLMAAAYAAGYMFAVPVLTALTDRVDARRIMVWGSLVSGLATIAFGLFAQGLVSAILLWGLAGSASSVTAALTAIASIGTAPPAFAVTKPQNATSQVRMPYNSKQWAP